MKNRVAPEYAPPPQQWLQQLDAALRTQGLQAASRVALQALADGVEHPAVLNLAAQARFGEGRFEEAVDLLERARRLAPNDPHVLNSLGVCLAEVGRADEAVKAYRAAIRADPDMAPAHFNLGSLLEGLNDIRGAKSAYERAAALDPRYAEPFAALAWLAALAGDSAAAASNGERALSLSPSNLLARMALASADLQRSNIESAAARLSASIQDPALTPVNRAIVLGLIGDLHDADGHPREAFAAYEASSEALKDVECRRPSRRRARRPPWSKSGALRRWFETANPDSWRIAAGSPARGRSEGARLPGRLSAIGHHLARERPGRAPRRRQPRGEGLLRSRGRRLFGRAAAGSNGWPDRASRRGSPARPLLGGGSENGVEPRGKVFIDKMPLSSVALPVIAKLFPNARILFALRDPRDVVLSCFRRRFGMNPSMYQLLTLEGAAAFYDAVMRLSEGYRELLPLPQHFVRYESLVDDFKRRLRGLRLHRPRMGHAMTDFAAKARTRGISTPSAAQVARGLNREGQGTWRRYREQMAPVLPLLEPWVERFGYG